jgi:hypothetical protein
VLAGAGRLRDDVQIGNVHEVPPVVGDEAEVMTQGRGRDPEIVVLSRPSAAVAECRDPGPDLTRRRVGEEHGIERKHRAPVRQRACRISSSQARVQELGLAGEAQGQDVPFTVSSIAGGRRMTRGQIDRDVRIEKELTRGRHRLADGRPATSNPTKIRQDLLGASLVGQSSDQDAQILHRLGSGEGINPRCGDATSGGPFLAHVDILARQGLGARVSVPRQATAGRDVLGVRE